ncbi:MAG: FHA domain-containing protein [Actinobacteria bacterium]|nr:FHA domain-containing protein [Actinomycetota bacterium]
MNTVKALDVSIGDRRLSFADDEEVVIGRTVTAGVHVDDPRVSRIHAVIRRREDVWELEDHRSANGTYVEGKPVTVLEIRHRTLVRLADPRNGISLVLEPNDDRAETLIPGRADTDLIRVGRATDNDIVLDDAMVSRYHAEIRKLPDGTWELRDAGSANGIFVEQQRITSVPLEEPLRVEMGDHLLRITPDGRGAVHVEVIARGRTMQVPKTTTDGERADTDGKGTGTGSGNITPRERELLALIAGGATDRQIADELYISIRTVRSHLDRIAEKTGIRRRADLTRLAFELGVTPKRPRAAG